MQIIKFQLILWIQILWCQLEITLSVSISISFNLNSKKRCQEQYFSPGLVCANILNLEMLPEAGHLSICGWSWYNLQCICGQLEYYRNIIKSYALVDGLSFHLCSRQGRANQLPYNCEICNSGSIEIDIESPRQRCGTLNYQLCSISFFLVNQWRAVLRLPV